MKVNENTIYIFLLGILAGIICMQCVNPVSYTHLTLPTNSLV